MSDSPQRGSAGAKGAARPRRGGKSRRSPSANRPNRAQQRAIEARTAIAPASATVEGALATTDRTPDIRNREPSTTAPRRRGGGARAAARPVALTRDEEYQFIRVDLRRLLLTGGSLLVAMIGLLVVLGG